MQILSIVHIRNYCPHLNGTARKGILRWENGVPNVCFFFQLKEAWRVARGPPFFPQTPPTWANWPCHTAARCPPSPRRHIQAPLLQPNSSSTQDTPSHRSQWWVPSAVCVRHLAVTWRCLHRCAQNSCVKRAPHVFWVCVSTRFAVFVKKLWQFV